MSGMHRNRIEKTKQKSTFSIPRTVIQLLAAAVMNGYAAGFAGRKIYTGNMKALCVPVLNCYSCPGALGACPVGALQAVLGKAHGNFPFYVLGTLMLFGVLLGRLACGFLCPFGLVQDLLARLPLPTVIVPKNIDKPLRYLKYAVLLVMVILLPAFFGGTLGARPPYFCEYFCPAGTLEGGIPLVLLNSSFRSLAGRLFQWKIFVLVLVLAGAAVIPRFFCRYFCPLGAFYSLFNRFSLCHMDLDKKKCTGCGACEKCCPMQIQPAENINSPECIRCGRCKENCPADAITSCISRPFS